MTKKARILGLASNLRQYCTAVRRRIEDEGDWFYSSDWWETGEGSNSQTVFRAISDKGNGAVSVLAHPSSKPVQSAEVVELLMLCASSKGIENLMQEKAYWHRAESWLKRRYAEIHPACGHEEFRVIGYQWRTLHFNDHTRQSTVKIMAAYGKSDPASVILMQQPHCLAVPYVKSMISAGLATISSCGYDLSSAVRGKKIMNILCIGHGGGSIPLFLASKIQGAAIHVVEIDPVVISASTEAMGFPKFAVMTTSGERACSQPDPFSEVLWKGIHERLLLHESDAEKFISESTTLYDIVFIDAYDGEDIFPNKLRDPDSPFLRALGNQLHPEHGTVVVNLHSGVDFRNEDDLSVPAPFQILPMGKYVSEVCKVYRDVLLGSRSFCDGLAYTVSVPWLCNTSLVVCRGFGKSEGRDMVLNSLLSKSLEVESMMDLPFTCLQYLKRGLTIVD